MSQKVTEARAGPQRAGVVAKPSEGCEGECEGDWALCPRKAWGLMRLLYGYARCIFPVVLGVPKWTHLGTRNGPIWGPEMIPFEDSKLTNFGTDLGTENKY